MRQQGLDAELVDEVLDAVDVVGGEAGAVTPLGAATGAGARLGRLHRRRRRRRRRRFFAVGVAGQRVVLNTKIRRRVATIDDSLLIYLNEK